MPFEDYFSVDALQAFHRVITMETFMRDIAPVAWPYQKRFGELPNNPLLHVHLHATSITAAFLCVSTKFMYVHAKYSQADTDPDWFGTSL